MDEEICTICIGNGILDDDYTFYTSGKIRRNYDRNTYKFNLEVWIEAKDIPDSKKQKLLDKCEAVKREIVELILK